MKKISTFLFTCLLFFGGIQFGQSQAFELSDLAFNGGIGLGNGRGGYDGGIGFGVSGEYGMWEVGDDVGVISLGAAVAYRNVDYDFLGSDFDASIFSIGPRGAFHWVGHDVEALDLYAGFGIELSIFSFDTAVGSDSDTDIEPVYFAGARYMFSDGLGAFAEISPNSANLLNLGVTIIVGQ